MTTPSDTPRTEGTICKCLDLIPENACDEYVELCRQLERELLGEFKRHIKTKCENARLKQQLADANKQIEAMRCCGNCENEREKEISELHDDLLPNCCAECSGYNNWKLKTGEVKEVGNANNK